MTAPPADPHWTRFVDDPDDRVAFELLEEKLFMAADWGRLADLYRRRRAAPGMADRASERAQLALRLGQLLEERLQDAEGAIQVYTEAVRLDPSLHRALGHLRRLYAARRSWEMVLQIAEQQATLAASGEERARIYADMSDVWLREVGDEAQAAKLYARARAESGGPEAGDEQPAADEEGVQQTQLTLPDLEAPPPSEEPRGSRVVQVLERKLADCEVRGAGASPEAARLRLRIAELRAGALGDPAGAVEILEPLLDRDETLLGAAAALSGLYEQLGRQRELIELAENAARLTEQSEQRVYWYRRAAETARAIGEPERAISCYQDLLSGQPGDLGARAALCDLYRSRGDRGSLACLLRDELGRTGESREMEVQLELAGLAQELGADESVAIAHLRRCLELEPRREDLLERALRACESRGGPLAQLDLVEHVVARSRSDRDRAALLARRGVLLADALAWEQEAAESWRAALELDPEQALARERLASCSP